MRIAVDAGHGSKTEGKRTPPMPVDIDFEHDGKIDVKKGESIREHTANTGVAFLLVKELVRCGIQTVKTGFNDANSYDDKDTPLSERQSVIRNNQCDYSVCIHFDASGDGSAFNSAEGVGIYIHDKYNNNSEALASTVLKHLIKGTKQKNRGVLKQSLAMCNCNKLGVKGAILVELAFMTNLREATELMASQVFWREAAREICMGICEFTGIKYVEETIMPKAINRNSSEEDIKWLQKNLNDVLEGDSFIPLAVDGIYGSRTRIAVLIYWEKRGWNQDGAKDGFHVGSGTIEALS
ncbi:N-acetylmuramoyl-L-alanine amidase [Anaerocolumna sp. MB42-C2]|uniref:N-acetylmuramoyl-L-alanine amidase n=1 Tax=Anaerocolumna sp. MB42-C2 TaxID=3070997 RepID=UPI0027E1F6C4|nr:N-acetylmuramoyl-L-alanine amidase [Anaerocolumna sp. MB42-C2]WMJ90589.1 N-acetylmuramoyl-L-alanine amidase [Anaerocolumna sp. MB42-C2]